MEYVFSGVKIEYISCEDLKTDANLGRFDYVGQYSDTKGEVWTIIKDVKTGKYYCTNI